MAKGSFDHWLTAAHDGKPASDVVSLGIEALSGVTAQDRQQLDDAFGVNTVGEFASNRFVQRAKSIAEEAAGIGHDPGPNVDWTTFFSGAPLATYQAHPAEFRLDFGPIYYRGRLDGSARVLVVGQDPAANELIGHRAFVGSSGQRVQGFLRRIGIRRDYLMVNTFLYPVFGQFSGSLKDLSKDPAILGFRNRMLDRIANENPLEAVIAVGGAAVDAVDRWPGKGVLHVQHITHPSAHDHAALLTNWNQGLTALRNVVDPEAGAMPDNATYGADWVDADHEPIPRRDLPFGVPEWHGVGSHASRDRLADGSTDHKRIVWKAP
ncbi:MAG: uracil-DNA glycosylase family protein [Gemmatimonadota bacterium]